MTDTYEPNKTLAPIKNRKFSLLLVDDEQNILSSLKRLFRPEGYEIHIALGGQEGLSLFETNSIDLVISDMRMPDMDGAEFLKIVARKYPDTIRILLTGFSDITSTVKAINEGQIIQYFCKPWDDDEIKKEVKHALKSKLLEEENKHLTALTTEQNIKLMQFNELLEQKVFSKTQIGRAHV